MARTAPVSFFSRTTGTLGLHANWGTPPDLFDALNREFHFTVDVCAEAENAKLPIYFDKATNGLKQSWSGVCWMYGREIGKWIKKAYEAGQAGATVVCLVPARTDTRWWNLYCTRADVRFIQNRVNFIDTGATEKRNTPAPFPSAIVIFSKEATGEVKRMSKLSKDSRRPGWWFSAKRTMAPPLGA